MEDKVKEVLSKEKETKAISKLKKDKVEISINPKKFLLSYYQEELKKLESKPAEELTEEETKLLEQMKQAYQDNIKNYSEAKLEAVMVPLKYRDLQSIKDSVLEAVKYSQQFNWDDDIKMRAMLREEHTMTVYLVLRKKDNINEHYYANLEEIAKETESTIEELYRIYLQNFVLTEEERKNF